MKKTSKPIINFEEEKLFITLNTYKYLDIDFIKKYFYLDKSDSYVYKRMQQLEYNNYIKSEQIYEFKKDFETGKIITITRKIIMNSTGANEFLKLNMIHIQNIKNVHLHYIKHQLELAKSIIKFENAEYSFEENKIKVIKILNESECSLSTPEINIRPDLGIILSINGVNTLYFIELEKRYATPDEIRRKMIYQYSRIDKYKNKLEILKDFDIKNIRILFVSSDKNKKNNLIEKIKKYENEIKVEVLFTTSNELELHSVVSDNILKMEYDTIYNSKVLMYQKINSKEHNE